MRNIKLIIAYDGTDFSGFQRQGARCARRTVQGELEAALACLHKAPVPITGAGRTDAGVHAAGQVVNFYTSIDSMAAERFVPALNSLLPPAIRVLEAAAVPDSFHARFDAITRNYRYALVCGREALPHERRFALALRRQPDIHLLHEYCRFLHGEVDCSLFVSPNDSAFLRGSRSPFRSIRQCYFSASASQLVFEVSANAFFWRMVRSMLGTLLFYEERGLNPAAFATILKRGIRASAGPTLPPQGLFLWSVEYGAGGPAFRGGPPVAG